MKAITYRRYGSPEVLRLQDVAKPTPLPHEVLIRVHAAAVSAADSAFRQGNPLFARLFTGLIRPRAAVLGTEFAGRIEAVGEAVTRFQAGDEIYAATGAALGAHAEYVCIPEDGALALKPANMNYAEAAAACEGALTALPFLRDEAGLHAGQSILINGASGSVGTAAVQLAKHYGAEVTAVCSTRNVELMKELGADEVIDYVTDDFSDGDKTYDVIFDCVGKRSFGQCKPVLARHGVYLGTVPSLMLMFDVAWSWLVGTRRAKLTFTGLRPPADKASDLEWLKRLIEADEFRACIDGHYSFEQAAQAHHHVDTGRKRGNVVLEMPR